MPKSAVEYAERGWIERTFTNENRLDVPEEMFGVYVLVNRSRGRDIVRYVGRGWIRDRLYKHMTQGNQSQYFAYTPMPNDVVASELECKLFHKYGKADVLWNENHPTVAHKGMGLCSVQGCNGEKYQT